MWLVHFSYLRLYGSSKYSATGSLCSIRVCHFSSDHNVIVEPLCFVMILFLWEMLGVSSCSIMIFLYDFFNVSAFFFPFYCFPSDFLFIVFVNFSNFLISIRVGISHVFDSFLLLVESLLFSFFFIGFMMILTKCGAMVFTKMLSSLCSNHARLLCCLRTISFLAFPGLVSGPRLNIKTVLSTYGDFHVKDKTAVRTSYL